MPYCVIGEKGYEERCRHVSVRVVGGIGALGVTI